jgi:protein-disulfide isomerase
MNTKDELRALRAADRRKQNWMTIAIIGLGALLVAGVLIIPSLKKVEVKSNPRPMADFDSMGDKNAKVKVEEFSDFQCPYCKQFATEMEAAYVKQYVETGKVHWKFITYSFIGEESVKAAEAAYCAADQGKFWEYHDLLFANQNGENQGVYTQEFVLQMAKELSLDIATFQTCIDYGTYAQKVTDNMNYGQSKGVNGTPYFLVNDKLVDSGNLEAAIEEALIAE